MELKELIERVKAATGPDRELDAFIGWHVDGWASSICPEPQHVALMVSKNGLPVPTYTASVDAALILAERLCPDLVIKFTRIGDGSGMLQITEAWRSESGDQVVDDMSPLDPMPGAIAIILALLTALDQKEENK